MKRRRQVEPPRRLRVASFASPGLGHVWEAGKDFRAAWLEGPMLYFTPLNGGCDVALLVGDKAVTLYDRYADA